MHILDRLHLHLERAAVVVRRIDGVRFTADEIPRPFLLDPKGFKLGKTGAYARFRFNLKNGEKVPLATTRQRQVVMTILHKRLKASKPGYKTAMEGTNLRVDKLPTQATEAWLKKEARRLNGLIKGIIEEMKTPAVPSSPVKVKPPIVDKRPSEKGVSNLDAWLLAKDGSRKLIDIAEGSKVSAGWTIMSMSGDALTISNGKAKRVIRKWLLQNPTFGHSTVYGDGTAGNLHFLYEMSTEKYADPKEAAVYKILYEASGSQTVDKDKITAGIKNRSSEFFINGEGITLLLDLHLGSSYRPTNGATGLNSAYLRLVNSKMGWPFADPREVRLTIKDVVQILKKLGLKQSNSKDWTYSVQRQRGGGTDMLWTKKE